MSVIVAFISQKGGTGKSTLARALGAVVAYTGLKVRIADLDPQQHTVVEWEKIRQGNDLPTLHVAAFQTAAEAIATAEEGELLILDAPGRVSRGTLEIAEHADLVVQPCGGSVDDLRPAVLVFHELVEAGIPKERLVVALCRMLSDGEEQVARAYFKKAGYEVLPGSIPERLGYRDAQNRGQALNETKQKALRERVDELMLALVKKVDAQIEAKENAPRKRREKK